MICEMSCVIILTSGFDAVRYEDEWGKRLNGYMKEFAKDIPENHRPAGFIQNAKSLSIHN